MVAEGFETSSIIQEVSTACGHGFRSGVDRWCSVPKIREKLRCVVDRVNTAQRRSGYCWRFTGAMNHHRFLVALWPAAQVWRR